jgi:hypothetical protein
MIEREADLLVGARFSYELDADNRLRAVSPAWLQFALDNEAADLARKDRVLGQSVWSFVTGEESRRLYGLIFQRARSTGRPVSVPFRCDSPTVRRFMVLEIEPLADGGLRLTGVLERRERRPYAPLLDPHRKRSNETIAICSCCKRAKTSFGWLEVEEAVRRLHLFSSAELPQLEHRLCDDCTQPWHEPAPA